MGALCDALEDAAGDYAAEAQKPDPYGVVGPYKIYEAREADFRELRSPKKLEQRHIAAAALARRHTETIVVTTNRLVRADTAADRRRILKSREATTSKLEGELATDLGRLAGGKCNLSVFGSAVPA